jgi:hypothetical protein
MGEIPETLKPSGLMALCRNNRTLLDLFPLIKGLKTEWRFNLFKRGHLH